MRTTRTITPPHTATGRRNGNRQLRPLWLVLLAAVLWMLPYGLLAQGTQRDVITIKSAKVGPADGSGAFLTGAPSADYAGVYVIDVGDMPAKPQYGDDGYALPQTITVTLSRPQGRNAQRAATVKLGNMRYWDYGETYTFAPGETEKTVEIGLEALEPSAFYEDENGDYHGLFTWSGNIPEVFSIKTTYAEAEYDVLMLKVNRTGGDPVRQSTFATKLEVLQNTFGNDHANYIVERWGEYILFRFFLATDVKITNDSRYVINARFADHTGMGPDDDDYGLAQTHEVELHPINAGSVCSEAWYIYRPGPDEYFHSIEANRSEWSGREVNYPVLEVGPFEVANPAEDAVRYIFYSRADIPEESANSLFGVYFEVDGLRPEFSNVSINKTSFKSGETMVITATMDNWQFVRRCQGDKFKSAFGVTLNGNETLEPGRYTFDEQTGLVTYYVTAPTVSETTTVYVDFGPACRLAEDNILLPKAVQTRAENSFTVTVSPEAATPNPVTQFDIPGLPADSSLIILREHWEYLGNFYYDHKVDSKYYGLNPVYSPLDATNANQISYSITNADGANASIIDDGLDGKTLWTGVNAGTFTLTVSISSQVLFSRTYTLMTKEMDDDNDQLAMPVAMNHTNQYLVGTVFPKLQFELKNPDKRPLDDDITVNYTHANGTTWTEHYKLSELQKYDPSNDWSALADADRGTITYDLPFSFTEEHPDMTDISQIGQTVITAQVLIGVPTTDGPKETITCTARLVSDLKKISIGDYSEMTAYWNEVHPITLTSEVFYLPRAGFTVGYEIPELGIKETYNNLTDGDNVPEWLELQQDDFYATATITLQPELTPSESKYHLYTLAQRSYSPDEVMLREMTCIANLQYVGAEGHIVYKVNGVDETGNSNFDNTQAIQSLRGVIDSDGFYQDVIDENDNSDYPPFKRLASPLHLPSAVFEVNDDFYNGADITLKCGSDVIQTLNGYKGRFFFQPPADGKTYEVEVYFTGYNRRYTSTFKSEDLSELYHFNTVIAGTPDNSPVSLKFYKDGQPVTLNLGLVTGTYHYTTYHDNYLKGIVRTDNPANCFLTVGKETIRLSLLDFAEYLRPDVIPELMPIWRYADDTEHILRSFTNDIYKRLQAGILAEGYWKYYSCREKLIWWDNLSAGNTQVTVVNSQGEPITNAKLHYACVDANMNCQETKGTANYDNSVGYYQVSTDPYQYAELIEVEAQGYKPMLTTMTLWNYDYNSRENRGKQRRHVIVLQEQDDQFNSLVLETFKREGNLKDNKMDVAINTDNLLSVNDSETLNYSQTADYKDAIKHIPDPRFGNNGWTGTKYAHIIGCMPYQTTPDLTLASSDGALQLQPTQKLLTTDDFPFSTNYCLFDFDLTDQIAEDATVQPTLMNGTTTLASLPSLHNQTVDLMALNEANNIEMSPGGFDLTKVDDQAKANGANTKDMNKAFDKFNFQVPPVLPFTVNIQRDGDHFMVRAVCEVNFLPGGPIMDQLDKLDNLQYFDEQFSAMMDAVNSAKPADDDFFEDIPRLPSAFVGIKGYLSGVAYYNRETGKVDFNFYDGGLTFEASAKASANLSFGIGHFGMSVDAMMAMSMGLVNTSAEMGDASFKSTKIDFVFDYQARLKVCAWAYAGIDIWIAKAVAGVRGGACFDLHHRAYVTKGQAGMKTTLHAQMEAFAEARFLFWKTKKTWPIFKYHKEYLVPNNPSNPFHPSNAEPIFSRRNVTKGYKKLKRKAIADLGTPIISNVNGMAQPTYLMDGTSLLFNNLKEADEYNDDRLQVYSGGSKNDFVSTDMKGPMYDFSVANNGRFEMVAFEQLEKAIDGDAINGLSDNDQTKTASEMSRVHIACRLYDGTQMFDWNTQKVSSAFGSLACVNPVVAAASTDSWDITKMARGAVVWQQGVAKFNDEGSRYIDGSLMLKRHSFFSSDLPEGYNEPIEIKRISHRNVPADYQVAMKEDSVLVMMALQQDVNNQQKSTSLVYVSVSPDNKVRERYTMIEGSKPQMVNVNGGILVAYIKQGDDGRDIVLNTVNMKGETTGRLTGPLGMNRQMINDYRLVVMKDSYGAVLSNVALLWSQSDEERTDNSDGTQTVQFKNRIYASMLNSHNNQLFFSAPIEIATMPDDVTLVSMDGMLEGLDLNVAFCVANEQDGAAVLQTPVTFTNAIDHRATFNPYDMKTDTQIPVNVTVVNNGFDPITDIEVRMGEETTDHHLTLLPQESTEVTVDYTVPDNFDGTIDYDVTAIFGSANSGALKSRRLGAKARPRRVQQSGTQVDVRQVDMALKVVSKKTDAEGLTTIIAEVNNASLLPLANGMNVKVGLYDSPLATEKAAGSTEVTVSYNDLYDATAEQKNKVKIVSLTVTQPDVSKVLYLRTTPMQGSTVLTDVRPSNNVLPVSLVGKFKLGDTNHDTLVNMTDAQNVVNTVLGKPTTGTFYRENADVSREGDITISDAVGIVNIILNDKSGSAKAKPQP